MMTWFTCTDEEWMMMRTDENLYFTLEVHPSVVAGQAFHLLKKKSLVSIISIKLQQSYFSHNESIKTNQQCSSYLIKQVTLNQNVLKFNHVEYLKPTSRWQLFKSNILHLMLDNHYPSGNKSAYGKVIKPSSAQLILIKLLF